MIENQFADILAGLCSEEEIKSFLLSLKTRGETVEDLSSATKALLQVATPFPRPNYLFADLVGTGGDEQGTYNISTAAALVTASMGLPVAKHGNKSVSSKCGAADVLLSLGARLDLTPEQSRDCLDRVGFCFLLAPLYHPAMRHVMRVRQALKTRTIFNLLGPLVNPARPPLQLTGVYEAKWCRPMAETLRELGVKTAWVVYGSGLDEIAVHAPTHVAQLLNDEVMEFDIQSPELHSLESIRGGDPDENAQWLKRLLKGQATKAQMQAVAVNASALLRLASDAVIPGLTRDPWVPHQVRDDVYAQTIDTILSGKAYDTLDAFITYTREQTH